MTKREPGEVANLDQLMQENEELRSENTDLKKRLGVAQELLGPKWKECAKLLAVFGESPVTEGPAQNGDPLGRFRPLLDKSNREANRKVAQTVADMNGRATVKQLTSATGYSPSTVKGAVKWLRSHGVVRKEGIEVVIEA